MEETRIKSKKFIINPYDNFTFFSKILNFLFPLINQINICTILRVPINMSLLQQKEQLDSLSHLRVEILPLLVVVLSLLVVGLVVLL